jgi:hypothetical protein
MHVDTSDCFLDPKLLEASCRNPHRLRSVHHLIPVHLGQLRIVASTCGVETPVPGHRHPDPHLWDCGLAPPPWDQEGPHLRPPGDTE